MFPHLMRFGMNMIIVLLCLAVAVAGIEGQSMKTSHYEFGPFNFSYYGIFQVNQPATISNNALQVTPDSAANSSYMMHKSGRALFLNPFNLWEGNRVASFNSSFLINIYRLNNSSLPGEGLSFVIAPDLDIPPGSDGQYLGLTNSTTDGNSTNHLIAIELDTFKQDFDPDDNHMGLDINGVRSNKTVSLSKWDIQLAPNSTRFYMVWIQYDGSNKLLQVFMAEQPQDPQAKPLPLIVAMPTKPVLSADLDLSAFVKKQSYLGFAASTGSAFQLNCVLKWNLTVELLPGNGDTGLKLKIGLGVGVPGLVLLLMGITGLGYYLYKKRIAAAASGPNILGTLKSLPGTPREFLFKDLKKATNNFDDRHKLGQGGFGVVYKGLLPKENMEVAVKKFSRDSLKGKDDFLAELSIINRLRHKHLVRLLGWCHKNGVLLLVYDYMPNGSLDNHLFCEADNNNKTLGWDLRYKIISGVASALHYLHNEYDQKVVHRDLKASNIMLDSNFNARLGDFGLARALDNEKTSYAELEGIPGTMGYIAPECFHTGKATCESDVYGFGAVLLEVVCGQRPWTKIEGFHSLVDWIWWLHREGRILEALDKMLGNDYVVEEAQRVLLLGLACSHPKASERPTTQAIVQIISGAVGVPHVSPFKPAFVWPSSLPMSHSSIMANITTADTTPITMSSSWHFGSAGSGSGSGWTPQYASKESYVRGEYSDSSLV